MVDGKVVVRVPAHLSPAEEKELVDKLVPRVLKKERRRAVGEGKLPNLKRRAADINERYFGGKLEVREIKWVTNQEKRYGSCTPSTATIRISDRVAALPLWVLDYVLVHELSHLIEANHSGRFWMLVAKYPLAERAGKRCIPRTPEWLHPAGRILFHWRFTPLFFTGRYSIH